MTLNVVFVIKRLQLFHHSELREKLCAAQTVNSVFLLDVDFNNCTKTSEINEYKVWLQSLRKVYCLFVCLFFCGAGRLLLPYLPRLFPEFRKQLTSCRSQSELRVRERRHHTTSQWHHWTRTPDPLPLKRICRQNTVFWNSYARVVVFFLKKKHIHSKIKFSVLQMNDFFSLLYTL